MQTFNKGRTKLLVLLRMDNTTVVAYTNNMEGTASKSLLGSLEHALLICAV